MNERIEPFTVDVKTNNYDFKMEIREIKNPHMFHFTIGEKKTPCLEFSVILQDVPDFFQQLIYKAYIANLDSLQNCVANDITENYLKENSLAKELIETAIKIIKTHFKHVKMLELSDASYIPCNRVHNETLDLLTYSIALYGSTWYEKTFRAYIENIKTYEEYKRNIKKYMSNPYKSTIKFEKIMEYILKSSNEYAIQHIFQNQDKYKELYNESETLPIFFRKLSETIPKEDKCKLFKGWLENIVNDSIKNIPRTWVICMYSQKGGRQRKNHIPK